MKSFKPWVNFSAVTYTDLSVSNDLNPQNKSLPNNIKYLQNKWDQKILGTQRKAHGQLLFFIGWFVWTTIEISANLKES